MTHDRLIGISAVTALVALVGAGYLFFGSPDETTLGEPTPTPAQPTREPTPVEHPPVVGERAVETVVVSHGPIVFRVGDERHAPPQTDNAAVERFVEAIAGWLDRHLTALQDDAPGLLEEVAAPGLIDGDDSAAALGVTTGLASADAPVSEATYHMLVAIEGVPQWVHVRVDLNAGNEPRSADFVFAAGDDRPLLVAAAPVDSGSPKPRVPPPPEEGAYR